MTLITTTFWPGAVTGTALSAPAVSLQEIETNPELAWVNNWQKTGLLAYTDKNGDGLIQYFNEKKPVADAGKALADANKALAEAPADADKAALEAKVAEAVRGWIRRARRGTGVGANVDRSKRTYTAYFYAPYFQPYGQSWGGPFAPTRSCDAAPSARDATREGSRKIALARSDMVATLEPPPVKIIPAGNSSSLPIFDFSRGSVPTIPQRSEAGSKRSALSGAVPRLSRSIKLSVNPSKSVVSKRPA